MIAIRLCWTDNLKLPDNSLSFQPYFMSTAATSDWFRNLFSLVSNYFKYEAKTENYRISSS